MSNFDAKMAQYIKLTEENLREIMYRTAGTPFRCEAVEISEIDRKDL